MRSKSASPTSRPPAAMHWRGEGGGWMRDTIKRRLEHIKQNKTWYVLIALILIVFVLAIWCLWDWLRQTPNGYESPSTTIRNLGLFIAAPIALWLAWWRARVADQQAEAARRQIEVSQQSLRNERYQKGTEMFGSAVLSTRLGGIYALTRLAREDPDEYYTQIMSLFCTFVRNPPAQEAGGAERAVQMEKEGDSELHELRPDVQAVMDAIGSRRERELQIEKREGYELDLSGAKLRHGEFKEMNLSRVRLFQADLSRAKLVQVDLTGAFLLGANMSRAHLAGAKLEEAQIGEFPDWIYENPQVDLSSANLVSAELRGAKLIGAKLSGANLGNAILENANLTGAIFSDENGENPAKELVKEQLNKAWAVHSKPPQLNGVKDFKTGEQLVWEGGRAPASNL